MALARELGKVPAEVNDFPGFVSNRILMPFINEAAYALLEGVAEAEAIDTIAKLGFAHPMGPLALADLIGLDTCVAIMDVLHDGPRQPEVRAVPVAAPVRRSGPARPQERPRVLRLPMSEVDPRVHRRISAVERSGDEEFVDAAFLLVLRRPPDAEARSAGARRSSREGTMSRASLPPRARRRQPEFERVRQLDDVIAFARGARARGERPRHLRAPPETDERLVEVPWVLARLRSGRILDVGYAFAEPAYIAALIDAAPGELVGVDLAEAAVPGFETVVADARELPFLDSSFDQILRRFDARAHRRGQRAVRLARRAGRLGTDDGLTRATARPAPSRRLARDRAAGRAGRLRVVPPGGRPRLDTAFHGAGYFVEELEAYELGPDGWRSAPTFDATGVVYGLRGPAASAVLCAELSPRRVRRLVSPDGVRRTHGGASGRRIAGSAGRSRRRTRRRARPVTATADASTRLGSATGATA